MAEITEESLIPRLQWRTALLMIGFIVGGATSYTVLGMNVAGLRAQIVDLRATGSDGLHHHETEQTKEMTAMAIRNAEMAAELKYIHQTVDRIERILAEEDSK